MIVDTDTFNSLAPHSHKRILCRCDSCGVERHVRKQTITCSKHTTYVMCAPCTARELCLSRNPTLMTEEVRKKLAAYRVGKTLSDETKKKIGDFNRGKKYTAERVAKMHRCGSQHWAYNPDREFVATNLKVKNSIRTMLQNCLKRAHKKKTDHTYTLLGYTSADLKAYLESMFKPGMSWLNRSEWHIDHIKPVIQFIKEGITDPAIICALSNLQPLWAQENLQKNAKWTEPDGISPT